MQRAQRPDTWVRPDPVDYCLALWRDWMHGDADRDLGHKTMRGLVGDGDGRGVDASEAQQASDARIGAATDAMIDGLVTIHRLAIYRSCGITNALQFPVSDLATVANEARQELQRKMQKNICTAILF